jgi:hypothetical protein
MKSGNYEKGRIPAVLIKEKDRIARSEIHKGKVKVHPRTGHDDPERE